MTWAKLHTDILGDDKLLEAAAEGAAHLHWLPWLLAFAKRADDNGRLTTNGKPAKPAIIAYLIPGATAQSVASCMDELAAIGVLVRDADGVLGFAQWEERSGSRQSDEPAAVAERVKRHREKMKREQQRDAVTTSNALQSRVNVTSGNCAEKNREEENREEEEERVTAPRPLASASTETEPPRLTLPAECERFITELYGMPTTTQERRADIRRQLMDSIDPTKRGAFLRRGVYVKAKNADHLARVCLAVRMDPPQQLDSAIVYVLRKLQDAETDANGRTVTEAASFENRQTDALLERYEAAAKAAANAWVKENREAYNAITARLGVQFPGATTDVAADSWIRIAYNAAHLSEVRKASGFPDFETWRANLPWVAKVG